LCKHQIIVLLTCTYLTKENIIEYCGTWYGTNCGGFKTIFMDPTYLQLDDGYLEDKDCHKDLGEDANVPNA